MNKKIYSANFPLKDFAVFLLMHVGRTFNADRRATCSGAELLVKC